MMLHIRSVSKYLASICRSAVPSRRLLRLLLLTFSVAGCSVALAQTAHFSGTQIALGGGFDGPRGVAVDGSGNVFVADSGHNSVREIPSGCLSSSCVIALGGGFSSPKGIGVDGGGNVFVADSSNNKVKRMPSNCTNSGCVVQLGGSFAFNGPTAVAVDGGGDVFVADYSGGRVEEIPSGCSSAACVIVIGGGFVNPDAVAVDGSGNVFVSDDGTAPVGVYEIPSGCLASNCVTRLAVGFSLSSPRGVALDSKFNLYVSDANLNAVEEIFAEGGYSTVTTLRSNFNAPRGVAVDSIGNVYVGDYGNNAVEELKMSTANLGTVSIGSTSPVATLFFLFDSAGTLGSTAVLTQGAAGMDFRDAGTGSCQPKFYNAGDSCTVDVTFTPRFPGTRYGAAVLYDGAGNVFSTGYVYGGAMGPQTSFLPGAQTTIGDGLVFPQGIATDENGAVYIGDTFGGRLLKETPSGSGYAQSVIASGLFTPEGIAVDGSGNVYAADFGSSNVYKETLSASGTYTQSTLGSGFSGPRGVAVDGRGNVYVADSGNNRVMFLPWTGTGYGAQSTIVTGVQSPQGLTVDGSGNIYIGDTYNGRVLKESLSAGLYTESTVASELPSAIGVAVDANSNVYVACWGANVVYKETLSGGTYTQSTLGTGLNGPTGVAVDRNGNVFVADYDNSRAVKLDFADAPTVNFPSPTAAGTADSTDGSLVITLENSGNIPLMFSQIAFPSDFPEAGVSDCTVGVPLAAGVSCPLTIKFSPPIAARFNENVFIEDNNLNVDTAQVITVSGTGTGVGAGQSVPIILWTPPGSIFSGSDLSTVLTAAAQDGVNNFIGGSFVYTATPVDGIASSVNAATVLPAGSYSLAAYFTPDTPAQYTPATATAQLNVIAGNTVGNPPATLTVTITMAETDLISGWTVLTQGTPGLDFNDAGTGSCGVGRFVEIGDTCTVNVNFTPLFPGNRYGAVAVIGFTGDVIGTGYVSAVGVAPQVNFLSNSSSPVQTGSDLKWPYGIAVDAGGSLYIADTANGRVLKETPSNGSYLESVIGSGLSQPTGIAVDGSGNVYIADPGAVQVLAVPWIPGGYGTQSIIADFTSGLSNPTGVAVDGSGNVYISDTSTNQVLEEMLNQPGDDSGPGGNQPPPNQIRRPAILPNASLNRVKIHSHSQSPINSNTYSQKSVGSGYNAPRGVAVDGSGNVYVADTGNSQVVVVSPTGSQSTVANAASNGINQPYGVAVDAVGNVYIADTLGSPVPRILKETPTVSGYVQSTVASGLVNPEGVAVDGSGNVYFTDSGNGHALKVDFADAPTLSFATASVASTSSDSPQSVTILNSGNAPLTFSSIAYPIDFPEAGSGDCAVGGPLSAGATCPLTVNFTPTVAGTLSEAVMLVDNSLNGAATQMVLLNGNGFGLPQTIIFSALGDQTYGVAPIQLAATASSGLTVSYTVISGPATVIGSWLTITGAGVVTVRAAQTGNSGYAAASPVSQSFTVNKATLTVTAANAAKPNGAPNPDFNYVIAGFVSGDNSGVVSGTAMLTTAATDGSPVGTYPITFAVASLSAANYNFTYVTGILVVYSSSSSEPQPMLLSPASAVPGGAGFTLTVFGENFTSNSVVLWNGAARATTYVSSTQLTASILTADIANEGTDQVTVANLSPPYTTVAQPFTVISTTPVATISGAVISAAADGSGNHVLSLTGSNFISSSSVNWTGLSLLTTYISPWELTATITAAQYTFLATTPATVTVVNPAGTSAGFQLQ